MDEAPPLRRAGDTPTATTTEALRKAVSRPAVDDSTDSTGVRAGRLRGFGRFLGRLGPAGLLTAAALVLPPLGVVALLGFMPRLAEPMRGTAWGPPLWALVFAVVGGLALLPTAALSAFAGWAFGFTVGCATALGGFVGAAVLSYAAARRAAGRRVVDLVDESPRWRAVHRALLHSGPARTFLIVFLLRVPAFPPFTMTSVALASVGVRWRPFLLGTIAGVAPRTAAYVYLAARAEHLDLDTGGDVWLLLLSAVALLAVIAILTLIARRALAKLTEGEAMQDATPAVPESPIASK